jgi:hypothetical protein
MTPLMHAGELSGWHPRPHGATKRLSVGTGVLQPRPDPFLRQSPFELSHRPDDLEHQPARWGAQVEVVFEADECHTVGVEVSKEAVVMNPALCPYFKRGWFY